MAEQVPFKEGCLTVPLSPPDQVRLKGIRCRDCGSLALGTNQYCINCTSKNVDPHIFSKNGKIYSYTVIRHAPPPPYPQETFRPFPVAWVELEDGLIILSEITGCGLDDLDFGKPVELNVVKGWVDDKSNDVMMYKFRLIK